MSTEEEEEEENVMVFGKSRAARGGEKEALTCRPKSHSTQRASAPALARASETGSADQVGMFDLGEQRQSRGAN
jgi:hypothetical protein